MLHGTQHNCFGFGDHDIRKEFIVTVAPLRRFKCKAANPMRAKSFFFAAAIALTVSSCAPTTEETPPPNALLASPDTVNIASATAKADLSLKFRCGCAFTLDSLIAVSGDVDKITMTATDQSQEITQHIVQFSAKPGTASGTYAANYLFKAYGSAERAFLSVPVYVKLTIP
jgi:hypothetical protein